MRPPGLLVAGVLFAVFVAPLRPDLQAQPTSETERNRAVVTRFYDLVNQGDWQQAAELFAPDVRHHLGTWRDQGSAEVIVAGREVLKSNLEDLARTFPDRKAEIIGMVADADTVVVRSRASGTHRGVGTKRVMGGFLVGLPPTGKHFQVQHMHWYVLHDGLIVDHYASRDDLGMLQQLGVLPTPPREEDKARAAPAR